jgi:hypothetical protein
MAGTDKLRELILYVAGRCEGDPRFGKTKLSKILFYADFIAYMRTGKSITNQDYRKAPFGPMGADMETTLSALKDEEALAIARRHYHGRQQQRPLALRDPKLDGFTAAEIALVNEVINDLWEQTAAEVSQVSHDFIGWQAARNGEIIPYETCLIDVSPLTEEEEEWARQVAQAAA